MSIKLTFRALALRQRQHWFFTSNNFIVKQTTRICCFYKILLFYYTVRDVNVGPALGLV